MAQWEPAQRFGADERGDSPTSGVRPGTAALMRRWRERFAPDAEVPEREALRVVEAVLDDLRGADDENLDVAGKLWGQAHRSVSEMVENLSHLRSALATSGVEDPLEMHRALDKVTAAATEEVMARIERVSRTDALTGVGNRRAFDESIHATLSAASRQGHEVTVVVVDLDGLKRINDTAGHAAGDAALIALVRAFYDALRDEDLVFRLGGDEFVIVLPFTSVDTAEALMQRVAATDAPAFTWGAAGYPVDGVDAGALVNGADQDLYRRRGANRAPSKQRRNVLARLGGVSRITRWAWVPAAAVLVLSLVATLVSAGTGGDHVLAQKSAKTTSTTSPNVPGGSRNGSGYSGNASQPGGGTSPSTSSSGSYSNGANGNSAGNANSGTPAQTTGFTPPSSTGGTPGSGSGGGSASSSGGGGGAGSPGGGGGSSGGGGGGTGSQPPPASGGLIGAVGNLLGPLPLVGNDGLLPVVEQLLVGQPSSAAGTVEQASVPSTFSSGDRSGTSGSLGGLLHLLTGS